MITDTERSLLAEIDQGAGIHTEILVVTLHRLLQRMRPPSARGNEAVRTDQVCFPAPIELREVVEGAAADVRAYFNYYGQ